MPISKTYRHELTLFNQTIFKNLKASLNGYCLKKSTKSNLFDVFFTYCKA